MCIPEVNLELLKVAELARKGLGLETSPARVVTVCNGLGTSSQYHWVDLVDLSGDPWDVPAYRTMLVYSEKVSDATKRLQPFGFRGDELTFFAQKTEKAYRWLLIDPQKTGAGSPEPLLVEGQVIVSQEYRPNT